MEWPIGKLEKYKENPILIPLRDNRWESAAVYNGTAIEKDGKIYVFYRAEEKYYNEYVSKIGLAISEDGFKFKRYENPLIFPEEEYEKRGCEDPRICEFGGEYYMTYVAYSGPDVNIALAVSKDLIHWEKKGILIKNSKSGGLIPGKINGKYFMYFWDTNIYLATSEDLKKWEIIEKPVLIPREESFDSKLVEIGPCPIITEKGIFLIYNSFDGIKYNIGYAMFDKNSPEKLIARTDEPVLFPEKYWESYGKVNYVVFAEGLVEKNERYLLYYGGADKSIGLAVGEKVY